MQGVVAGDDGRASAPLLRVPVGRALWAVAWPVAALGLVRSGYYLADTYWAARLGADASAAVAALGVSAFAYWIVLCLADLTAVGTHALVAHAEGARDAGAAGRVLYVGLASSLVAGLALAAFADPLSRAYFALVGFDDAGFDAARRLGVPFVRALLWGACPIFLHNVTDAAFRGIGDTRTPMVVSLVTLALNVVLDPWLIFGGFGMPSFGLAGAASATVLANGVASLVGLALLARRGCAPVRPAPRAGLALLGRVAAIGSPQALSGIGFCLVYVTLTDVLHRFGPSAMGALGIGHRVEGPAYQICVGFSVGAATLVGQNVGAGRPREAVRAAHKAALAALAATTPFALVIIAGAGQFVAFWAPDPLTRDRAVHYLVAVGVSTVPMALEVVYEGAFAGAGRTGWALAVLLPLTALRIPLATVLALRTPLGLEGVWVAIAASTTLKGLLIALAFRIFARRSLIEAPPPDPAPGGDAGAVPL